MAVRHSALRILGCLLGILPLVAAGEVAAQLVMQQDRRDGADLLTVRYPLLSRDPLRTDAGAGLNRAVYFSDDARAPVMLNAELRWADLDESAILLRADDGYVGADPVAVGVSVGWRFR